MVGRIERVSVTRLQHRSASAPLGSAYPLGGIADSEPLPPVRPYDDPLFCIMCLNPIESIEFEFEQVIAISFVVLATLYTSVMLLGHATFGDVTRSNILLNYAEVERSLT